MEKNYLTSLTELANLENLIISAAKSGQVSRTKNLCEKLNRTAKQNVRIAHSIRNKKYSDISEIIRKLHEKESVLSQDYEDRTYKIVEHLIRKADFSFHTYLDYFQSHVPELTKQMTEFAEIRYRADD